MNKTDAFIIGLYIFATSIISFSAGIYVGNLKGYADARAEYSKPAITTNQPVRVEKEGNLPIILDTKLDRR